MLLRSLWATVLVVASSLSSLTARQAATAGQPALPASLQQLAQDVDHTDARVRRKALRALRERGGPESLVLLGRLVGDDEPGIREDAIEVVTHIYVEPPPGRRLGSAKDAFELAPFRVTPWPAPPELSRALVRALADDYPSVRRDSAYALAVVEVPPVSGAVAFELLASLSDRDAAVRVAAARALGLLRVRSAGVPLIGRVNDEVLDVRLAAMRALGDLRETAAVPALTDQFAFYVRGIAGRAALDAVARIGDPASGPLFEAQTGSSYPAHRRSAYEGLARSGTAKVTASLIEAAQASERDERVRLAMAFALASAGRPIDQLVAALPSSDLSGQALEYLIELGGNNTALLTARLRDQDALVRQHVATALGFVGGPEASAALAAADTDASIDVRNAIQIAQLRIRRGRP
jgi:HEAT repeat protein